jgi:hypothetical protein
MPPEERFLEREERRLSPATFSIERHTFPLSPEEIFMERETRAPAAP